MMRKQWLSRCRGEFAWSFHSKVYLFCSETCQSVFKEDFWLYTHLRRHDVIAQIRRCNRVFVNVGFGSECLSKVHKIAEQLDLQIVDLVDEAICQIQRRKLLVKKRLIAVKGFQEPEQDEFASKEIDIEDYMATIESTQPKTAKTDPTKPEFMEVVEITEDPPQDSLENPQADEIFAGDTDSDELPLEREDMEHSQESLEEEVFKGILTRRKQVILVLRTFLRPREQSQLSREVEDIFESIGYVPDHLISIYVDAKRAVENLYDEKMLRRLLQEKRETIESDRRQKLQLALDSARNQKMPQNMDTINMEELSESEKLQKRTMEEELADLEIDVDEVLGEMAKTLTLPVAKERLKANIIQRVEAEFERVTAFAEKLSEKQSLIVPVKMAAGRFEEKNQRTILQKLKKLILAQASSVRVNGIGLVVSQSEGETAREQVLRLLREKQVELGERGLRHLWRGGRLKSEDFPVLHEGKVHFLGDVQDFWELMRKPRILEEQRRPPIDETLKVFLGGFDQSHKARISSFLQEEFGLVRLTRQKVIREVLFGVKFAELLRPWDKPAEQAPEDARDAESESAPDEDASAKIQKEMDSILNGKRLRRC